MKKIICKINFFYVFLGYLLIALIWVYARTLGYSYVTWDDPVLVLNNILLQNGNIKAIFSSFYHGDYIPITFLSYFVEIKIFGINTTIFHLSNMALHFINVILLYCILKKRKEDIFIICTILAFFALHPVQVESVAWISERKGLLATLFIFLCWYNAYSDTRLAIMGRYVFFALSLLSKSICLFFPLFLIYEKSLQSGFKKAIKRYWGLLLIAFMAGLIRTYAYYGSISSYEHFSLPLNYYLNLPIKMGAALIHYLGVFVNPTNLSIIYPDYSFSYTQLVLFFLLFGITVFWFYKNLFKSKHWFFLFLMLLFPVLHFVPRINFVNDRYLYLPIIGIAAITGTILKKWKYRNYILAMTMLMMTYFSALRVTAWENGFSLWKATQEIQNDLPLPHIQLGIEYKNRNNLYEAYHEFDLALKLDSRNTYADLAYGNLGIIYASSNSPFYDLSKAEESFLNAINQRPIAETTCSYYFNLMILYRDQKNVMKAEEMETAIRAYLQQNPTSKHFYLIQQLN